MPVSPIGSNPYSLSPKGRVSLPRSGLVSFASRSTHHKGDRGATGLAERVRKILQRHGESSTTQDLSREKEILSVLREKSEKLETEKAWQDHALSLLAAMETLENINLPWSTEQHAELAGLAHKLSLVTHGSTTARKHMDYHLSELTPDYNQRSELPFAGAVKSERNQDTTIGQLKLERALDRLLQAQLGIRGQVQQPLEAARETLLALKLFRNLGPLDDQAEKSLQELFEVVEDLAGNTFVSTPTRKDLWEQALEAAPAGSQTQGNVATKLALMYNKRLERHSPNGSAEERKLKIRSYLEQDDTGKPRTNLPYEGLVLLLETGNNQALRDLKPGFAGQTPRRLFPKQAKSWDRRAKVAIESAERELGRRKQAGLPRGKVRGKSKGGKGRQADQPDGKDRSRETTATANLDEESEQFRSYLRNLVQDWPIPKPVKKEPQRAFWPLVVGGSVGVPALVLAIWNYLSGTQANDLPRQKGLPPLEPQEKSPETAPILGKAGQGLESSSDSSSDALAPAD